MTLEIVEPGHAKLYRHYSGWNLTFEFRWYPKEYPSPLRGVSGGDEDDYEHGGFNITFKGKFVPEKALHCLMVALEIIRQGVL